MLKKILPIFFILCLVFSLTVPCFASSLDDFQIVLPQVVDFKSSYSRAIRGVTVTSVYNTFYFSGSVSGNFGGRREYESFYNSTLNILHDHYYFVYISDISALNFIISSPSSADYGVDVVFYFSANYSIFHSTYDMPVYVGFNFIGTHPDFDNYSVTFYIFDITDYYVEGLDPQQFYNDIIYSSGSSSFYNLHNYSFFPHLDDINPLSYQFNFFKVFNVAEEWNSFLSPIIIFGVIIVSELIFIFIGVFLFKRFRGG